MSRLAVSSIAWEPDDDEAVAVLLKNAGFGGIELAPTTRWAAPLDATPTDVTAFRNWWESRGFKIVAMQSLLYGRDDLQLFGTEPQRQALLDYLGGIAALAASLGVPVLVFGSPKNRQRGELPIEEALDVAVEFFRRLGTMADTAGVRFAIEPNPPEYQCDFITTTAEAVSLVERVNRRGIGVQCDMGAITMVGDAPGPAIRNAGRHIAHFHASEPELAETGTGRSDHPAAARALAEIEYQGWISIEMKKAAGSRIESITRAVRLVRAVYQRVAR
jgi:sugar phosphate isomerase/epimerase